MSTSRGYEQAMHIIRTALAACDPSAAVAQAVKSHPPHCSRPAVIAIGKAAASMYGGLLTAFPGPASQFMVVPAGTAAPPWALRADHPLPTPRCLAAATALADFVRSAKEQNLCDGFVVLLSGGASSLITLPFPSISLDRYAHAIDFLLHSGRGIREINTIRKHCEQLKGGRLAALMHPLPCDAYLLSDVIGDDPSTIGSGPTVPDPTTMSELNTWFMWDEHSPYGEHIHPLTYGLPETPKPGDALLANSRHTIVGSNLLAVHAAVEAARSLGLGVSAPETGVVDDARIAGQRLATRAMSGPPNLAVVFGGETVVRVPRSLGRGGRNQHLALAAALEIEGRSNITIASFATDGVDGRTDAAGAIVTGDTCRVARSHGLDPEKSLLNCDSFTFFSALERLDHPHLIRTGPTGTNVNDIAIALVHE